MLSDITLGQYLPGNSVLHRMDPRVTLLLSFACIVFIFVAGNFWSLLLMAALAVGGMILSGVPVGQYLKSLRAIIVIVVFTSVLNLFYGSGDLLFKLGVMEIRTGGVLNSVFIAIRIVSLILFSTILTFTTSPTQLTDAVERIMKPLSVFHIKVHEIAMMMTIALRFVPTLLEETDKIMSAQKARGADMESGGLMQRAKALIPILIPLFVSSFRRAYDLAMAMECRCYHGGEGRTKMKSLHVAGLDVWSCCVTGVFFTAVIVSNIFLPAFL